MHEIAEFITRMTWQDWATALGVVFGLIGFIAYWEQRRASRQQETLVEFARRHVNREISEETLKKLTEQRLALEYQITQRIPQLARLAVLREQAERHAKAAAEHFVEWQQITSELGEQTAVPGLDPALERTLVDRLVPR